MTCYVVLKQRSSLVIINCGMEFYVPMKIILKCLSIVITNPKDSLSKCRFNKFIEFLLSKILINEQCWFLKKCVKQNMKISV